MIIKKEVDVDSIKRISLEILIDIDSFCVSHGIRYSLGYGTLLGAIRHKGFIPWDDDVDIMMLREDYDRFCKEYYSERYKLICCETDENCFINYARVYDYKETYSKSLWPWFKSQKDVGVWIDVFPLDNVSDDFGDYCKEYKKIQKNYHLQGKARGALAEISRDFKLFSNLKTITKRVMFLGGLVSPRRFTDRINRIARNHASQASSHCAQLMCAVRPGKEYYYNKSLFDSFIDVTFEDKSFKAISKYDDFLTIAYGDYMQLPPIEKRVRHHHFVKYFFKDK